jgi:hypothetical protein
MLISAYLLVFSAIRQLLTTFSVISVILISVSKHGRFSASTIRASKSDRRHSLKRGRFRWGAVSPANRRFSNDAPKAGAANDDMRPEAGHHPGEDHHDRCRAIHDS